MAGRADEDDRLIRWPPRAVEGYAGPVAGGDVGGGFVVAAAQVLHEHTPAEMIRADRWRFSPRIRPEPCFQPSVIGFDRLFA